MKRLSPAKRNQLIMVAVATVGLICLIYFFLIEPQYAKNKAAAKATAAARIELQKTKELISKREVTASALQDILLQLSHAEEDIAAGDVYAWTYDTVRRFKTKYQLDIPSIGQPSISEVDLVGNMPYKQVKVNVAGSGYYQDLGKFVADFENDFPHMRLVNLIIEPNTAAAGAMQEKLSFRMDLVALVKPNN